MRGIFVVGAAALLLGCASQPQAGGPWTRWVCDSQAEVRWRYADSEQQQIDVRVGDDDVVHRLRREPAGSGALYSDGRLSLHSKGAEGLLYWVANDDLIGRGCKLP